MTRADILSGGLTFVSPVWNERDTLDELVARCRAQAAQMGVEFRMVLVDDGSTDGSREELRKIAGADARVTVLLLRAHRGKSAALGAAFDEVRTEWAATLDSDLQDRPEELPRLVEAASEGADLVTGWRQDRSDGPVKRAASALYNLAAGWLAGQRLHDANSGLKLLRREVIEELVLDGSRHRLVAPLAKWKGFRVAEVPVRHDSRRAGRSKYGPFRAFACFLDIVGIVLVEKFENRPLHFFGSIGAVFFGLGALGCGWVLLEKLLGSGYVTNRPLFFIGILLMLLGANFFTSGMLAEFYSARNPARARDLVRERINGADAAPPAPGDAGN
jgi:glycosyltransferase involved in cell wall biosynthesis